MGVCARVYVVIHRTVIPLGTWRDTGANSGEDEDGVARVRVAITVNAGVENLNVKIRF